MGHFLGLGVAAECRAALGEDRLVLVGDVGGHGGADRAGADAVHRDALAAQLHRQRFREPDHAVLGGGVGRAELGRAPSLGGGDVDDAGRIGLAQVGQRRSHRVGVRRQQHLERDGPVVLVVLGVDRREARDAGVVDDVVDAVEPLGHLVRDLVHPVAVGHVHRPARRGAAGVVDLGHYGVHLGLAQVGDRNVRPLVGEQVGRGPALAHSGTGDQRHPALDRPVQCRKSLRRPHSIPPR